MALFLHKVYYLCFTRDTSLCLDSITFVQEWNCWQQRVLVSVLYTSQANMSANLSESRPYTWTSYEERKWDVGKERVSMACANGMITVTPQPNCIINFMGLYACYYLNYFKCIKL